MDTTNSIALYGGVPTITAPMGKGNRFGEEELANVKDALNQNTLFYWFGTAVKRMTEKFAAMYNVRHCVATSSGTAALHVALGTVGVSAGDEVIVTPITDMGSLIGILYQNAIPVFADLDPYSYNLDPRSVESKITSKTKAILVVHLTGGPADMDGIMDVAKRHNLRVIEDCAQSYLAEYKGRLCGTIGDIGCFSLNDFKQITAGDGGMLIMNDEELYERAARFADKNYQRLPSDHPVRDIPFIAPNYRMNELTGAVGLAQLDRLSKICARRTAVGDKLSAALALLPGIYPPKVEKDSRSTYWFYMFRIDEAQAGVGRDVFCDALTAEGVVNQHGYIPSCVYEYDLFKKRNAYDGTECPFGCKYNGNQHIYAQGDCPVAEEILKTAVRINIDEFITDQNVDEMIAAIQKVSAYFLKK
ncbi:MAG: DegT/DnrJ/EryC1/StrS family aminotransferase [Ruthenibacterium sp.]